MLRRVENVQVFYKRDLWGLLIGRYKILLQVGKKEHLSGWRVTKAEFATLGADSQHAPVRYMRLGERTYWRYDGQWHTDNENLEQEAVHALLVTRGMRQADRVNRAKTIAAQGQLPVPAQRHTIPDDIKQLVWNRDRGACQACAAKTELQYDHIIPISHGGGSTEANLQILCGPCNRRKATSLTLASGAPALWSGQEAPPQEPLRPQPLAQAAWYPDPTGESVRRYWDGSVWTQHARLSARGCP